MYIVIKHDFDNMENYTPHISKVVGYIRNKVRADAWIKSQNDKQYKGWDEKIYPYYTKEKVRKLK